MKGASSKRSIVRIARPELVHIREAIATQRRGSPLAGLFACSETKTARIWTLAGLTDKAPSAFLDEALVPGLIHCVPTSDAEAFSREIADLSTAQNKDGIAIVLTASASTDGTLRLTGAEQIDGCWTGVTACHPEGEAGAEFWRDGCPPPIPKLPPERVARFTSSFGIEAYQRLRRSTVAVIGAGGTGSVAIPTLARAGVGRMVIVDSDHVTSSNLERTQASFPEHVALGTLKARLARDHVRRIDPEIEVVAIAGRLPQRKVLEAVVEADVLVGCTDQHASRLALSDAARRYLIPAIDCGGLIEGGHGDVTGQIIQLVLFRPDDPCPRCRGMIDDLRVRQELMSAEQREAMKVATAGDAISPEAHEVPQIDTVGYITTISGTLAAAYTIGWLIGRFAPPFQRMQMNLVAECLDVTDRPQKHDPACRCRAVRGMGDLAAAASPFTAPCHWKPAQRVS